MDANNKLDVGKELYTALNTPGTGKPAIVHVDTTSSILPARQVTLITKSGTRLELSLTQAARCLAAYSNTIGTKSSVLLAKQELLAGKPLAKIKEEYVNALEAFTTELSQAQRSLANTESPPHTYLSTIVRHADDLQKSEIPRGFRVSQNKPRPFDAILLNRKTAELQTLTNQLKNPESYEWTFTDRLHATPEQVKDIFLEKKEVLSKKIGSVVAKIRAPVDAKIDAFKRESTLRGYAQKSLPNLLQMKDKKGEVTADSKRLNHHLEVLIRRTTPFVEQYTFTSTGGNIPGGQSREERIASMVEEMAKDPRFKDQNKVELKALLENLATFINSHPEFLTVKESKSEDVVTGRKLEVNMGVDMPSDLQGQLKEALLIMLRNDDSKGVDFATEVKVRTDAGDSTIQLNQADRTRTKEEIKKVGGSKRASDDELSVKKQLKAAGHEPVRKKVRPEQELGSSIVDRAAHYLSPENIHGESGVRKMMDQVFTSATQWQSTKEIASAKQQLLEGLESPEPVKKILDGIAQIPTKEYMDRCFKAASAVQELLKENAEELKVLLKDNPRGFYLHVMELCDKKGLGLLKAEVSLILEQVKSDISTVDINAKFDAINLSVEQQRTAYQTLTQQAGKLLDSFKSSVLENLGVTPSLSNALDSLQNIPTASKLREAQEALVAIQERLNDGAYSDKFSKALTGNEASAIAELLHGFGAVGRGLIVTNGTPILAAAIGATAHVTDNRLEAIRQYCTSMAEGFSTLLEHAESLELPQLPDMDWDSISKQVTTRFQGSQGSEKRIDMALGIVKSAQEQGIKTKEQLYAFFDSEKGRVSLSPPEKFYSLDSILMGTKGRPAAIERDTLFVTDLVREEVDKVTGGSRQITVQELDQVTEAVKTRLRDASALSKKNVDDIVACFTSFSEITDQFTTDLQNDLNALASHIEGKEGQTLDQKTLDSLIDRIFDANTGHLSPGNLDRLLTGPSVSTRSQEDKDTMRSILGEAAINLRAQYLVGTEAFKATRLRSQDDAELKAWRKDQFGDTATGGPENSADFLRNIALNTIAGALAAAQVNSVSVSLHFPDYAEKFLGNLMTYMKSEVEVKDSE